MYRYQSHQQSPSLETARVVLCYRNWQAVSHIGLGVAARNTAAVLRREGIRTEVWALRDPADLAAKLAAAQNEATRRGEHPVSHVVISAPWIPTPALQQLTAAHPEVVFAVSSHSNVGFLQADANGVKLLRESYELAVGSLNFRATGNCATYCRWVTQAFGVQCHLVPNLYDLSTATTHPHRRPLQGGTLRLGCFGATRILKNLVTGVGAAIEVSRRLNTDAEIWLSAGRPSGGSGAVAAAKQMADGVPRFALRELPWQSWPQFRQSVSGMDLLLQPSYTESFNMVTADGVAEGIASVTSPVIEWVPTNWHADPDDASDVADRAIALLHDPTAPQAGLRALQRYVSEGVGRWKDYLLQRA
jgi:hypothetical protein